MKDNKRIALFINSATKSLQLGLLYGEEKYRIDLPDPKKALETMHLGMAELFKNSNTELKDVDDFYCLLGPGSNTGIRLGLSIPRTIYALNPNIGCYGIKTLDLFMSKADHAALSDRNGNLYFGEKKDGLTSFTRIDKDKLDIISDVEIAVEKSDAMAREELKNHKLYLIDVLDLMMEEKDLFQDFSKDEENYLPEYLLKI